MELNGEWQERERVDGALDPHSGGTQLFVSPGLRYTSTLGWSSAPRTQRIAVFGGLAILFGAIGFHLSPWLGINVPGIGEGLFFTAVAMTVLNVYIARDHNKNSIASANRDYLRTTPPAI